MTVAMLAVLLIVPRAAHALGPLDTIVASSAQEARVETGFEDGVVGWLAYGHRLPGLAGKPLALAARFGLPVLSPDPGDLGFELGAQLELVRSGRWVLRNQLDLVVRTVSGRIFDGVEIAARDRLSFGFAARRGFFGVDVGWEEGLATHIAHSDWYAEVAYPDAEDGWLAFPMGRFLVGGYGGVALADHVSLALRLGLVLDETGRNGFVPLVAMLSGGWSF